MISDQSTVLVVDDELFFRKLYRDLLAGEGYQIDVCENGDDAIVRMQQGQVDLVLTDMVMPGKCGLEVLRAARQQENPPEVILVTGYASVESAIEALKSGARDYLVKPFNPEELKHLVRNCLEQRRLLAENAHLKAQIQLFETGQTLSSTIDLETLLPQTLDALLRLLGGSSGCSFLCRAQSELQLSSLVNLQDDQAFRLLEQALQNIDVMTGFQALSIAEDTETVGEEESCWVLPLGDNGALQGGILLADVPTDIRDEVSAADLRYLCDQAVLGFENASRFQDAQELMYTDDLTGLYNHRYMQVALEQEMRRSQRYGLQFSLLFLDLDHFKEINDQHGHLAGSAALQEVGELLRHCVRDVDTLFRFGGDEFAAMLVETDGRTAKIVAERIRKTIEEYVFLAEQGADSRLTVTAGYSTFPTDATERDVLLDLADRAMYLGKDRRNIVNGVEDLPTK